MSRKRPGRVALRRIVAGMFVFVGLFVFFFGLGYGSVVVTLAGVAVGLLAVAFRLVSTLRGSIRRWVVGTGRVVHVSAAPPAAPYGRCELQLVVDAPGLPQEMVLIREPRVPVERWPYPGLELPVEVAADDVRNVRILWPDSILEEDDSAWGDDQPAPAPAVPPGTHLDPPDLEIDLDLDEQPAARRQPVGAPGRGGWDPGRMPHPTLTDDARVPRPRPRPGPGPRPRSSRAATVEPDPLGNYPSAHPGPGGSIHRVGVTLLVTDLERSVGFYRDTLGFHEADRGAGTVVLASGDTRLVLFESGQMEPVNRRVAHLNLDVGDIDTVYAELKAAGVRFTYPPKVVNRGARLEQWAATFRDPDGHGIALTQWRAR